MRQYMVILPMTFLLYSCFKEPVQPEQLPPPSTAGEVMFACKVNGEIFIPATRGFYKQDWLPYYFVQNNWFTFSALNMYHFENKLTIRINCRQSNSELGTFPLSTDYGDRPIQGYIIDTLKSHYVTFTRFDTAARIVSGSFEFTCFAQDDTTAIYEITEGRFDLSGLVIRY
jgi:hypothetical protein